MNLWKPQRPLQQFAKYRRYFPSDDFFVEFYKAFTIAAFVLMVALTQAKAESSYCYSFVTRGDISDALANGKIAGEMPITIKLQEELAKLYSHELTCYTSPQTIAVNLTVYDVYLDPYLNSFVLLTPEILLKVKDDITPLTSKGNYNEPKLQCEKNRPPYYCPSEPRPWADPDPDGGSSGRPLK